MSGVEYSLMFLFLMVILVIFYFLDTIFFGAIPTNYDLTVGSVNVSADPSDLYPPMPVDVVNEQSKADFFDDKQGTYRQENYARQSVFPTDTWRDGYMTPSRYGRDLTYEPQQFGEPLKY